MTFDMTSALHVLPDVNANSNTNVFELSSNMGSGTMCIPQSSGPYPSKSPLKRQKMIYFLKFGEFGVNEGQFTEPAGVAVNNTRGEIIVADTNGHRVQVFSRDGEFKVEFGGCGKRDGQLLYPNRIAVNQLTGNLYITERSPTHQIQIFDACGNFIRKFGSTILQHPRGICVDHKGRVVVVECKVMRVIIFDSVGNFLSKFDCGRHLEFPNAVCTSLDDEILISDNRAHCIKVFNYEGFYMRQIGGEGLTNYPIGVAVDKNGSVIVADNHNNFNLTIFDKKGKVLNALESKVKHAQCYDMAVLDDGTIAVSSKDYRIYLYRYGIFQTEGPYPPIMHAHTLPDLNSSSNSNVFEFSSNMGSGTMFIPQSSGPYPSKSSLKRQKMIYFLKFGEFGVNEGQFTEPAGVAVNNTRGEIIVADTNGHRIQVFSRDGEFKVEFGGCGKRDGQLLYPNRIAVNQVTGNLFITERSPTHQIQIFDACGNFMRKFGSTILQHPRGICVDHKGRVVVVECKVMRVIIFDSVGNFLSKFDCGRHLEFPNAVCTSLDDEILISDNRAHCIKVFNYEGFYMRQIGGEGLTNYPIGVAVDKNGSVIVADNHNNFNLTIFDKKGKILNALESKVKHAQCYDMAVLDDGTIAVSSKDYRIYLYRYGIFQTEGPYPPIMHAQTLPDLNASSNSSVFEFSPSMGSGTMLRHGLLQGNVRSPQRHGSKNHSYREPEKHYDPDDLWD